MSLRFIRLSILASFCAGAAIAQQYTISTVAGSGAAGFADGAANGAQFNLPGGILVDSSGKLYVADSANHRIRTVSGGIVSTVAGNGTGGYAGDPGSATSAELLSPGAVAVDGSGNLYIADTGNHVIRKVSGGNISLFAGVPGVYGYQGDNGLATGALLNSPSGVAVDAAGNVYISDSGNNLVRKIDITTLNITAVFGLKGTANSLYYPTGIVLDSSGAIYVADTNNHRIVKWANNKLTTIAGTGVKGFSGDGGPATKAMLQYPRGLALDAAGNLYIADSTNSRIRKVTTDGTIVTIAGNGKTTFAGDGGPATSASLYFPRGVEVDGQGNVYIADTSNQVIRMLQGAAPEVSEGGVTNAASYAGQISPGALATVWGQNFGTLSGTNTAPWSTSFSGITVNVNGTASPIYYVSPGQINFQVPWETPTGTAQVTVSLNGGLSNSVSVPVVSAGPGLFFSGTAAIVENQDYSVNTPSNPAAGGSVIIAYLTGSGPVSPTVSDGVPTPTDTLVKATSAYSATIGSAAAEVQFTGLTPSFIGLVQMNILVPSGLAPGSYPLTVTIDGQTSNSANISVK
jgi:uncharacterized protein (TIGR03437 family)